MCRVVSFLLHFALNMKRRGGRFYIWYSPNDLNEPSWWPNSQPTVIVSGLLAQLRYFRYGYISCPRGPGGGLQGHRRKVAGSALSVHYIQVWPSRAINSNPGVRSPGFIPRQTLTLKRYSRKKIAFLSSQEASYEHCVIFGSVNIFNGPSFGSRQVCLTLAILPNLSHPKTLKYQSCVNISVVIRSQKSSNISSLMSRQLC